ncbi:MAG: hypothetical protein ACRDOZ_15475, partial [Nocardioides sp.]
AWRTPDETVDETLHVNPAHRAGDGHTDDGDDYIEGNGGDDTIFGGYGQDDLVGDSSDLYISGLLGQLVKIDNLPGEWRIVGVSSDGLTLNLLGRELLAAEQQSGPHVRTIKIGALAATGTVTITPTGRFSMTISRATDWHSVGYCIGANCRPVGADLIFGADGTAIARNDAGAGTFAADGSIIISQGGHARDSDAIAGDNAQIFRIVGTNGSQSTPNAFLTFRYDNHPGSLRIVPRAIQLLDYTFGGPAFKPEQAASDRGFADEIHGEGGDDFVYGMKGNDVLFGEGQDDDLLGGYGDDWISGGTGDDGILGDDGRIYTSRSGTAEPLYGLSAKATENLRTPGDLQTATTYIAGELHKAVQLDLDVPDEEFSTFYVGANDVAYGGWGNDFIHGGEGDDALSGAEALDEYYVDDPWALLRERYLDLYADAFPDDYDPTRGVLQWGSLRAEEFYLYDEFTPLRRIMCLAEDELGVCLLGASFRFLLDHDATENSGDTGDGKDTIFGDGGHDWMVGGTGYDRLFGGWGDDLHNADDDMGTAGGENSGTDTSPTSTMSYADIAYGGAGRDILIANTGADRLIDWVGEYNSYLVPFSPYGAFAISRMIAPALQQFLLDLARGSGADITRDGDTTRNGEPYGELGMVIQKDEEWQDQTGAPGDPQAGNLQGPRDVLRYESFNNTAQALAAFAVDSGTWRVVSGRYESVAAIGRDAVSLFYVDAALPPYYEVVGTVNADKSKAGYKSNAYLVFDYQSASDFKFAGLDIGLGKVQIGWRTANGWVVLAQANLTLFANRDYELALVVNGQVVTLYVDGVARLSHTFASPLIDPSDPFSGVVDPLTDGMVGVGSNGSIMRLGQMSVRVLTPEITFTSNDELDAAPAGHTATGGTWTSGGGRYTGTPGTDAALSLTSLGVSPTSALIASTRVSTSTRAGLAFDAYGPSRFKYVLLDVAGDRIVIGHRTADGWFEDRVLAWSLDPGRTYDLRIVLDGTTVTVWLDGTQVLAHVFNSLLNDGDLGLLAVGGPGSFDALTLQTDDPEMVPAVPFVSVTDVTVSEGPDGTRTVTVTVTLSRPSDQPVTVSWSTLDGVAVAGSDYLAASGT